MSVREQFHQALIDSDVGLLRRIWKDVFPDMPQTVNNYEAEIVMRRAQTELFTIPFKVRAYAHCWLTERDIPSGLPDHLKPKAERVYPVIKRSVGIAFICDEPLLKPALDEVQRAMEHSVLDSYADGHEFNQDLVKARMEKARNKAMRQLFGTTVISR